MKKGEASKIGASLITSANKALPTLHSEGNEFEPTKHRSSSVVSSGIKTSHDKQVASRSRRRAGSDEIELNVEGEALPDSFS